MDDAFQVIQLIPVRPFPDAVIRDSMKYVKNLFESNSPLAKESLPDETYSISTFADDEL